MRKPRHSLGSELATFFNRIREWFDHVFSPASQTVTNGATFNVQVRVNVSHNDSGDDDGITATVAFPNSRLQVVSLSAVGSSFAPAPQQSYNNGNGRINIFQSWGNDEPEGNLLITTVTFRATTTGNATVTYLSAEVGNDTPATSGANYTIVSAPAPPTPPATPPSNPTPPSSPSSPSSPTKPQPSSPTAPAPTNPGSTPPATDPATPDGTNKPDDNSDDSSEATLLPISLRVVDGQSEPVASASVVISKKTYRTDKKGWVYIELKAGKHEATISKGATTKKVAFTVKPASSAAGSPKTQIFTFALAQPNPLVGMVLIGGIGLGGIVAIATGLFVFFRLRRRHSTDATSGNESIASPIGEGSVLGTPTYPQSPGQVATEQNGMTIISSEEQAVPAYEAVAEPTPTTVPTQYPEVPTVPVETAPLTEQIPPIPSEQVTAPAVEPTYAPEETLISPPELFTPVAEAEPVYSEENIVPPEQTFVVPQYQPEEPVVAPAQQAAVPVEPVQQLQPQPETAQPHPHNNSVYLDEEEPKDMYEIANEQFHYREHPTQ